MLKLEGPSSDSPPPEPVKYPVYYWQTGDCKLDCYILVSEGKSNISWFVLFIMSKISSKNWLISANYYSCIPMIIIIKKIGVKTTLLPTKSEMCFFN